jgi:hypothetical protein
MIKIKHVTPAILGLLGAFSTNAHAATGTISLTVANTAALTKTSNISGPTFLHANQTGQFTASFTNLTNTSGSISADLVAQGGSEYFCASSFVTVVTNGKCHVSLANESTGGGAVCTYNLVSVNPSTCDFTASFRDQ